MSRVLSILFNTEMVNAILEGRKTVTRRVLKHPFEIHPNRYITKMKGNERLCPYEPPYREGDILYVRESVFQGVEHYLDVSGETVSVLTHDFEYYADGHHEKDHWKDKYERTWMHRRPSIHMPKEAARIWLKVTNVRVERLQDITEDGVVKEGIYPSNCRQCMSKTECDICPDEGYDEIDKFVEVWNSALKKSGLARYGWEANPYVWVIEFERCDKPTESEAVE